VAQKELARPPRVWWVARLPLHASRREAIDHALPSIESMGNHAPCGRYADRLVPVEPLAACHAGYGYRFKGVAGGPTVQLIGKPG
jgi:hypothetical protein